jgi:hypothetical protein
MTSSGSAFERIGKAKSTANTRPTNLVIFKIKTSRVFETRPTGNDGRAHDTMKVFKRFSSCRPLTQASYLYSFPFAGEDMVDFCASDGAFLTFIATSVASAVLLAPLSDAQIFRKILDDLARARARARAGNGAGAGLEAIQRIVALGAAYRDNALH